MKLDITTTAALAKQLEACQLQAMDTVMITAEYPEMDWNDAYAIQDAIRLRKVSRGSRIIGFKAGLERRRKL
jgi:2-oxo-3-hexenedioate decarboxylase